MKRFSVRRYAKVDGLGFIEIPLKPMYAIWDTEAKKFLMGNRGHSHQKVIEKLDRLNKYVERRGGYHYFDHDWNILPLEDALIKVKERGG